MNVPFNSLSAARYALQEAVRAGADTTPHRQRIAAIEEQHAAAEQARTAAASRMADDIQRDAQAEAAERLAALLAALPGGQDVTARQTSAAHIAAVADLAAARRRAGLADNEATAVRRELSELGARVADLDRQRQAIAWQRAAGDRRPEHGGQLELLKLDSDELGELQDRLRPRVMEATAAAQRAAELLQAAEERLRTVEQITAASALVQRIAAAEQSLGLMDNALATLGAGFHGEPAATLAEVVKARLDALQDRTVLAIELMALLQQAAGQPLPPRWGASQRFRQMLNDLAIRRGEG